MYCLNYWHTLISKDTNNRDDKLIVLNFQDGNFLPNREISQTREINPVSQILTQNVFLAVQKLLSFGCTQFYIESSHGSLEVECRLHIQLKSSLMPRWVRVPVSALTRLIFTQQKNTTKKWAPTCQRYMCLKRYMASYTQVHLEL